jgi:hypothetical protein
MLYKYTLSHAIFKDTHLEFLWFFWQNQPHTIDVGERDLRSLFHLKSKFAASKPAGL